LKLVSREKKQAGKTAPFLGAAAETAMLLYPGYWK
jgi:hypothetical protein